MTIFVAAANGLAAGPDAAAGAVLGAAARRQDRFVPSAEVVHEDVTGATVRAALRGASWGGWSVGPGCGTGLAARAGALANPPTSTVDAIRATVARVNQRSIAGVPRVRALSIPLAVRTI